MNTNTTPSTASQAPAVSICYDDKFRALLCEVADELVMCETAWEAGLVAYIDAKLAQARDDGIRISLQDRQESESGSVAYWKDRAEKSLLQASAAEAKLEAIRQGVEGLTRWDDNLGMCPVDYGPWIARTEVLSLLQPQPQADESGLPG